MYWEQRTPHTKATRAFLESIPERCSAKTWYCSTLYLGASPFHEGVSVLEGGAEHPGVTHSKDAMATFHFFCWAAGLLEGLMASEQIILLSPSNYFSSELHTEFPEEMKQREGNVLKGERGEISFPFWWPLCTAGMKHTLVHSSPE